MNPSIDQLLASAEALFSSLPNGWVLLDREIIAPDTGKGGFVLNYQSPGGALQLQYLDIQFDAILNGVELFGTTRHPGFSGNQFSRQNFATHLPVIAASVIADIQS
jgi:hypothetical protein